MKIDDGVRTLFFRLSSGGGARAAHAATLPTLPCSQHPGKVDGHRPHEYLYQVQTTLGSLQFVSCSIKMNQKMAPNPARPHI